jgi:hypothetical protein
MSIKSAWLFPQSVIPTAIVKYQLAKQQHYNMIISSIHQISETESIGQALCKEIVIASS